MLHKSLTNALSQIEQILNITMAFPLPVQRDFYADEGAGRHVRHILDHILALREGITSGVLDYNRRNRESVIEHDPQAATLQLQELQNWIAQQDKFEGDITIISEIDVTSTANEKMASTVQREVLYLVNHTIHHAAHIKLMGKHMGIKFPAEIGLAPATATYFREKQTACAP